MCPCLLCCCQVVQWDQELSEGMSSVQAAIIEVLEALIMELKKTNKIDW